MTDQPTAPAAQRIAMRITAATVPFTPGMDPNNPQHVLRVEFGPVATEVLLPESNVEAYIDGVSTALRRQVEANRAERLGVEQKGLIMPTGSLPDISDVLRQMGNSRVAPMPPGLMHS